MGHHTRLGSVVVAGAFVLLLPVLVAAQDVVISGRVQGQELTPVGGAVVSVRALGLSTVTDDLGAYRLVIPAARVQGPQLLLSVAVIGYGPQEVQLTLTGEPLRHDFTLREHAIALDAILVTGTAGKLERRAQSAVIASVDAARLTEMAPISSVIDLLQAREPGVSIQRSSGSSGTSQAIRIRGNASISFANEPLVFIDGILSDTRLYQAFGVGGNGGFRLNDIPPEDIESIEIVKGPAAATLYGADASAGVIQIITKRGRAGSRFSQNLSLEFTAIDQHWMPPDNWGACTAAATTRDRDKNGNPITVNENPCLGRPVGTRVTDNPLVRTGAFRTGQAVSLGWSGRGGGDHYDYYVSLTSDLEDGTLQNNAWDRQGGQFTMGFMPSARLRLEGSLGLVRSRLDLPHNDNDLYGFLSNALFGSPVTRGTASDGWHQANRQLQAIEAVTNTNRTTRTRPILKATFTPVSWFRNTLTLGADLTRSEDRSMFPRNDSSWYGTTDLNSGEVSEGRNHYDVVTVEYRGTVTRQLGEALRTDYTFGVQYLGERTDNASITGTGLITNSAHSINNTTTRTGGQSYTEEKSIGGIGQVQLSVLDRLYLKAAGRLDRHSAYGEDAGAFFSPSIGISYVVSDEPRLRSLLPAAISTLRMRSTWGITGRSPGSGALRTYAAAAYLVPPATVKSGVMPRNPGNPDLRPERGVEIEAGLDVGFWRERVGLELTYFDKTSKNLALSRPLPPSMGFTSSPLVNIGRLVNRGFEAAANARVLDYRQLGLHLRAGLNTLHNEVRDLGDITPFGELGRIEEGLQAWAFVSRRIERYDLEANRAIVGDSVEFVGNLLPTFEGNVSGTLTLFRNLRVYGLLDWKRGGHIYNEGGHYRERQFNTAERSVRRDSILTQQERLRRFGPFVDAAGRPVASNLVNEAYIESGDFVRLRELSASFSLPPSLAHRLYAQSGTITLAGRNLGLWTDFSGGEPEVVQRNMMSLPQPRRYLARVTLQF